MFGISGYFVATTWLTASEKTINEIQENIGDQIFRQIDSFTAIPLTINQEYYYLIQNDILNFRDERKREVFFANLIKSTTEDVYSFSYGTEQGEYFGARRNAKDEIEVYKNNAETKGKTRYYRTNPDLSAGEFALETGYFDPRTRDWYRLAKATQGPVFSPLYKHFVMDDLALSAARPVYDSNNRLAGVLGTHVTLARMNNHLKNIVKDYSGIVYIVESRSGYLVANSQEKPNFLTLENKQVKRIKADEIEEQEIVEVYQSRLNSRSALIGDNQYFVKLMDYKKMGLEWLIIVAIPKSQFMVGLAKGIYFSLLLTLVVIVIAIFIYVKSMDILLAPINNLVKTAEKFATGEFSERARVFRNDEIGILSGAFNRMAEQIDLLINSLEERINERTYALEQTNRKLIHSVEIQNSLREIAEAAIATESLDELYAQVHLSVARVLPAKNFFVALKDDEAGEIVVPYCVDEANLIPLRRPIGSGFTEYALRQGRAVYLTAADFERLRQAGEISLQFVSVSEWLGAPLRYSNGEVFGVIAVFSIDGILMNKENDTALMTTIAAQVSMAIERKRTEQALMSSQSRYHALVEQSFEALAVVDIQTQEVVEINSRFTKLLGYSLPEDAPLFVIDFVVETKDRLDRFYNIRMKQETVIQPEAKLYRHKNGTEVFVERAGSLINVDGRDYFLAGMRDVTAERRRQGQLTRDVEVASRLQRGLLPELTESPCVTIKTLYYPARFVSGDSYHLAWSNGGQLLRGFLIDVSGHGLATAIQSSAVNVLLREAEKTQLPLIGQLQWINARAAQYFTEDTFVAMIGFELDLQHKEFRYAGAGITQFYLNGEKIPTPGMFVGIWNDVDFTLGTIPVTSGDTFCFLTDGFTDALALPENAGFWSTGDNSFAAKVAALASLAESGGLRDDATGVCLELNDLL
jgi:PAS domain S-box-containing protein